MKYILTVFVILILVTGCTTTQRTHFGNYVAIGQNAPTIVNALALDTADQISKGFVPAQTKFYFTHSINDGFGQAFQEQLRTKGYAIAEYNVEDSQDGERLSYIIDNFNESTLLVRIYVGDKTLSRLYDLDQNTASPSGSWSQME